MASKSELLTHFKTLMNKWFPLTTEMNTALGNKEDTTNKRKSTDGWSSTTDDTRYPSEKLVKDSLDSKAPTSHTSSNGATYGAASTDVYGHVKLSTSTSSTSTSLAATASAVKSAYDKGNHSHPYEPSGAVSTHNSSASHYKYTITSSNYNPSIDSTDTTIKVKVTNVNGTAKSGVSVTVTCSAGKFANNTTSYTATTNSSGEISTTYKATEWGIINFSANTSNIQVKVTGFKTYYNDSNYTVTYDDKQVFFRMHVASNLSATSWVDLASVLSDTYIRPATSVCVPDFDGIFFIRCRDDSAKISMRSVDGNSKTGWVYASATWQRR